MTLARFDGGDPAKYPGFDAWYTALKVKTDRDSARRYLRQWLRVLTADQLGKNWAADLQEDNQLQRALYEAGKKIGGLELRRVPEYRRFVDELAKKEAAAKTPGK